MIVYVKFVGALDIKFDNVEIIKEGTYKKIDELAKKYDLKIIEDSAQAHGAYYKDKRVGKYSGKTSSYKKAVITLAEGQSLDLLKN